LADGKDLWVSSDYDGICKITTEGAAPRYTLPDGQNDAQPTRLAVDADCNV